ncbi:MAG: MBG domain-containing protein [Paludibacter sp.]
MKTIYTIKHAFVLVSFLLLSVVSLLAQTPQGIVFNPLTPRQYGAAPFTVSAIGGASGNPVVFTSSDNSVATCTGKNGTTITILKGGSCFIYANQAGNENYSAAAQVAQELVINKIPLTITAHDKTKIYDGAVYSPFTVQYYGFANGDTQASLGGTLAFTGSATTAVNVGTGYVITPGGLTSENYTISFVNGKLDINKAPLVITAHDKAKSYDGTVYSPFTVKYYGFVNGESQSVLGGTLAFTGSATSAIAAGAGYVISPSGLTSDNYAVSYVDGKLDITKAPLSITADNKSKTYNGIVFSPFTVRYTGFISAEGPSVLAGTLTYSGSAVDAVGAGTGYVITPGGFTSDNYAITFVNGTLDINKAPLTITAHDKSKTYNGIVYSPFTVKYFGFVNGEDQTTLGGTLAFSGTAATAVGAGTGYVITPGGLTSDNYAITYVNGKLNVNKAPLTITAHDKSKVYNGLVYSPFTIRYSGFANGEDLTALGGTLTFGGAAATAVNAGTAYAITPGGLTSDNYAITFVDGKLDITKAPLTITAHDKSMVYNGAVYSPFTIKYSGFANGENLTALGGTLTFGGTATTAVNVGTAYVITPGGLTSDNYTINFVDGKLDITKAPLTITAENKSKVFDGTVYSPFTVKYTGFIRGEDQAQLGGALAFSGSATTATTIGTGYVIIPGGLTSDNYTITFVNGVLDIMTLGQTITFGTLPGKTYGDAPFTVTATASSGLGVTFSSNNTTVATVSGNTVTIVGAGSATITATQPGDVNYIPVSKTQTLTVNSKVLTITGVTAADKDYDGTTTAVLSGGVLNGVINSDDVTIVAGSGAFADANAGLGKVVIVTGYSLGGGASANYNLAAQPSGITASIFDLGTNNESQEADETRIYPTITTDKVQMFFAQARRVEVVNVSGMVLQTNNVENITKSTISLSGYTQGIYLIKLTMKNGAQIVKRIVLQK